MATSAPVRMLQCLFWPRKWIPCPNFAIFWCISCKLWPNLAHKYSKIFSFIARARGHLSLWRWIFLAHICFKSARKNVQVQLMKLTLIYCQKSSIFFTKSARALLLRFLQNQKMHVICIILSLHAKNQPPTTILSCV